MSVAALRRPAALLIGLCAVTAAAAFAQALTKPLSLDETDIAIRAHMVLKHGPGGFEKALGSDEGMTHPPLYEYTVALLFKLFGETDLTARLFGLLLYAVIGILTYATVRRSFGPENRAARPAALALCVMLYLANPLLVQHSLLVDADSTLIALLVAVSVYGFVRFESLEGGAFVRSRFWLACCIALLFLTKEITPVFLVVSIILYRLLSRQWKRLGIDLVCAIGPGVLAAALIWATYCHFTGTRIDVFIAKQYHYRVKRVAANSVALAALRHAPYIARWPLLWASAPFYAMVFAALSLRVSSWIRRRPEPFDLCWIAGTVIWVPYFFVKASADMMKYQQCAYPLFIAGSCAALADPRSAGALAAVGRIGPRARWAVLAALVLLTGYYGAIGDPIPILPSFATVRSLDSYFQLYYPPFFLLYPAAVWAGYRLRVHAASWLVIVSALLCLPPNLGLGIRQSAAAYTTVESWLNYGERGLADTVRYVSTRVKPHQTVMLRKDIYYYLHCRYGIRPAWVYFPDSLASYDSPAGLIALERLISRTPLDYIVLDRVSRAYAPIPPNVSRLLQRDYYPEYTSGDFIVLRSRRSISKDSV